MPKYTLVKTINADGKSPLFYFEGPSDATEPTDDWITDNSELLQKDTGVRKFKKGNTWEPIASSDGSGGGRMEVTFSGVNWEDGTVSHADKTIEEIVAAIRAKKDVVGFLSEPDKIGDVWMQLVGLSEEEEEEEGDVESETHFYLTFSGTAYNSTFTIIYSNTHESGEPKIEFEMLELAAEDAIADKATMTVELRVIGSDIFGNRTFSEILNARMDGRNVLLNYDDTNTGNKSTSSVVDCVFNSNDNLVLVFFYASGQLVTASGRQNDSFNYKP